MSNLDTELSPEPSDAPGCGVFSSKNVFEFDDTGLSLTGSYQSVFSYSGSGKLIGFIVNFDSQSVAIKLTIDSDVVFDVEFNDLLSIQTDGPGSSGLGHRSTAGGPVVDSVEDKFIYMPECPIAYDTEVKIEAKETTGGAPKDATAYCITLTKET